MEKETKTQTSQQPLQTVHKGSMEGILIVNGRPQMERSDMPSISFESILALQRFQQSQQDKQDSDK